MRRVNSSRSFPFWTSWWRWWRRTISPPTCRSFCMACTARNQPCGRRPLQQLLQVVGDEGGKPGVRGCQNLDEGETGGRNLHVAQEYELFLHEHVENTRAARIAATAPSHAQWAAIIRQQNALHRQLQQKIRLLAEMQEKRKREEERFLDNCKASLATEPFGRAGAGAGRPQIEKRY